MTNVFPLEKHWSQEIKRISTQFFLRKTRKNKA